MAIQAVWPVNDDGSIILKHVAGSKTISGFISQDQLPESEGLITVVIGGQATPSNISGALTASADIDGAVLIATAAATITIDAGMSVGFGFSVKGVVSFAAGAGVTINDLRTSGSASPWCCVVQIGTNQYDVLGSKV